MSRIPADFYSQSLWELLFMGLELWDREPLHGAGASYCFRGPSAAEPSSLLHVSAPPISFAVAFSLYPQVYVL